MQAIFSSISYFDFFFLYYSMFPLFILIGATLLFTRILVTLNTLNQKPQLNDLINAK